ncbi:lysophospholipid acyltransferase family protein [Putridiphycobacter roseus]|uniref:lysophospholipid acyltransferase family protein n=1 Tax=Putridiphycobacter roseus TaxID=2219161 RepID=UPI001314C155|nr:lysophospholipid acyltransferase family protein [Putridiphycobacter roseus]
MKLKVEGLAHFDRTKNYIILSNHTSYLDIPILLSALPVNIYFIAKKELIRVPFFGWMMWLLGMIFIDRKNAKRSLISMKKAAIKLKSGKNVLVFPEGTFDDSPGLLPFKKGAFHIAVRADIPLLPVVIKDADLIWPPNQILNFTKGIVTVKFGQPFGKTKELDNVKMVQHLKEQAEESIQQLLKN